ncbi:MAG TPA: SDR family NAD(P)-dependent oxidoreductase [Magnetococcales bacterium]|nr:SDR family NAD(P)-dependent oxidoreductase [Magnetococcales bacterium]
MTAEKSKGWGRRVVAGFKYGLSFFLMAPFLFFLVPLWFVYRQTERWAGRPAPEAPWKVLGQDGGEVHRAGFEKRNAGTTRAGGPTEPVMEKRVIGGVALVTGGGNRLGAMISQDLAALGFVVAVTYHRSEAEATRLVRQIESDGGIAQAFALDLNNPVSIAALVEEVELRLGCITLLVNNAGVFFQDASQGGWEVMEQLFKVNLQGPLWLSMKVGAAMKKSGVRGQVITLCDLWGERPLTGHAAYGAAKAGMIMATKVLARDLAPGVRVNAIAPGAVLPPREDHPGFQAMLARTPLAGEAGPDGVRHAVRYLLGADFVTGEVLHVDGGRGLV